MTTRFRHVLSSALMSLFVSVSHAYPAGNLIVEFNSNGAINARPFEKTGLWEIQWKGDLVIAVYSSDDNSTTALFQDRDETSSVPTARRYYLSIAGSGIWTVTVRAAQ